MPNTMPEERIILMLPYGATGNPDGLPPDWPALVEEYPLGSNPTLAENWVRFESRVEYEAYRAAHQASYDAYAAGKKLIADKAAVWELIKNHRDTRMASGVYCNGHWFHTDLKSITQHSGLAGEAKELLAAGATNETIMTEDLTAFGLGIQNIVWKTMSGAEVPMTCGLAIDLAKADKKSQILQFGVAKMHKAYMELSSDPLNYNFKTGWPPIYGE